MNQIDSTLRPQRGERYRETRGKYSGRVVEIVESALDFVYYELLLRAIGAEPQRAYFSRMTWARWRVGGPVKIQAGVSQSIDNSQTGL